MGQFNQSKRIKIALTTDELIKSAGDVVGGLITIPATVPGNGFILRELKLVDDDNQAAALTIYLFEAKPTAIADNAPFAASFAIADHQALRRKILIAATTDYEVINSNASCIKPDLNIDFPNLVDGNIYAYIPCTATPTYSAGGLTLYAYGWED